MRLITLTHGLWHLELAPAVGGSIAALAHDGQDILRRVSAQAVAGAEAREMACFPLVPFSNRIENGRFTFDEREIVLAPNMGDHPHPLHGAGWRGAWEVADQTPQSAALTYAHEADAWPWRYQARQDFSLADDILTVRLGVTNLSERPMPAGLGLHPYFPRTPGAALTTGVTHLWEATNEQIPIRRAAVPAALDFREGLAIEDLDLDHCFAGWNGDALITWPGQPYRLRMSGDATLEHLVVYTPPGRDFFCVEAVENMNNAFNWMSRGVPTGVHVLAPGASHAVSTVFRVEPSAG
jgi:aldose 1-epimerase